MTEHPEPPHIILTHDMMDQKIRLGHLLYRFVQEDDVHLSDMEFVRAVFQRLLKERNQPLIDPNE